jgi:hypothetical protein
LWSSVIPPLLNSEHTFSGGIHIAFDSLSFDCAVLLFGKIGFIIFQFSPEIIICFHKYSLSAAEQLFHHIFLRIALKFHRTIFPHNLKNLIPDLVCLFHVIL